MKLKHLTEVGSYEEKLPSEMQFVYYKVGEAHKAMVDLFMLERGKVEQLSQRYGITPAETESLMQHIQALKTEFARINRKVNRG